MGQSSEKVWEFCTGKLGASKNILIIPIIPLRSTSDQPHRLKPAAIQHVKNISGQCAHDASPTSHTPKSIIWLKVPLKRGLFPYISTRRLCPNLELYVLAQMLISKISSFLHRWCNSSQPCRWSGYFSAMFLYPSLSLALLEARKILRKHTWKMNLFTPVAR